MTPHLSLHLEFIVLNTSSQLFIVMLEVLGNPLFILQNFIGRNCSNDNNDRGRGREREKNTAFSAPYYQPASFGFWWFPICLHR